MGYAALSAFLDTRARRSPAEAARLAQAVIMEAINADVLLTLLEKEAETIAALMDKADRVDDLEREVTNLKWNLAQRDKL
mgnify:CR=1 FL=1